MQSQKRMALSIDEANRAVKRIVESLEVRKLKTCRETYNLEMQNISEKWRTRRNIQYLRDHQGRVSWSWDGSARPL